MGIPHTDTDYIVSPGDVLAEILEARLISENDFASRCGQSIDLVCAIVAGEASLTEELAQAFGRALETSPEMWVNLEYRYRLNRLKPSA